MIYKCICYQYTLQNSKSYTLPLSLTRLLFRTWSVSSKCHWSINYFNLKITYMATSWSILSQWYHNSISYQIHYKHTTRPFYLAKCYSQFQFNRHNYKQSTKVYTIYTFTVSAGTAQGFGLDSQPILVRTFNDSNIQ